jgi:NAD(P)-dependent dehydrogenase (short-subunit alcohol dehydrogenase family)
MDISGAAAVVTGGASGLGEATVRALAGRGARVVVLDMADDRGAALAKEVGGVFAHADVTDTEEVIAALEAAADGTVARRRQLRRHRICGPDDRSGRIV